ncbi:beta-ketoacyl synthase N-terminal-like domain-containing protein [Fictibacillus nanhaiensis]|uniref:beta-ketoacyl synthase N-terminal-like domain-containing protein n=1 Tax=Fictibacillus nanhaiensis TaxID=742169 RepID=UPI003C20BA73
MEQLYKFIIDQTTRGKIEKETAIELVKTLKTQNVSKDQDIAIIGMASKTPLADTVEQYWDNLKDGLDCITEFSGKRMEDIVDYLRYTNIPEQEIAFNENGFIEEIDKFDYKFFKLSLKEASLMDPHQRLFLETAWHAIEDAGYGGEKITGSDTGVYVGFASSLRDMYLKQISEVEPSSLPIGMVGNLAAVLPSRISYLLNLKGPSMVIDTACSSSLVAIDLACEAIRKGDCSMAIAGGIKLNLLPLKNEHMTIGIESTDSRTRAFNDVSDGSGIGDGAGAVLLKPLTKAIKDKDRIYAVIKGSAVNQDGSSVGITAPNPAAQTDVIMKAWENAKIDPESISYMETHGTGTKLGDPIEVRGIKEAFRNYTNKNQFCAIGSVKTNIGHTSEAAGILSVIKVAKALQEKKLPPSLYFQKPNQAISFQDSPIYVNPILRDWKIKGEEKRRAGVSSFGISGTNCHVVLEEAPYLENPVEEDVEKILTLSAFSVRALQQLIHGYKNMVYKRKKLNLQNMCYTANTGRAHYPHRIAIIFRTKSELVESLEKAEGFNVAHQVSYSPSLMSHQENEPFQGEEDDKTFIDLSLLEIGKRYVSGVDFSWPDLYREKSYTKELIPLYPFDKERCWIDIPVTHLDKKEYFYSMNWKKEPLTVSTIEKATKGVLIFRDEETVSNEIVKHFEEKGVNVVSVRFGEVSDFTHDREFVIAGDEEDYVTLINSIKIYGITDIIHCSTVSKKGIETFEDLTLQQKKGVYSIFYLLKALVKTGSDQNMCMTLLTSHVHEVTGHEAVIKPENAPIFGITKTIAQEHPGLSIRSFDIDEHVNHHHILQELEQGVNYQVAFRSGERYVEEFVEVDASSLTDEEVSLRDGGVYIITGGTGGIGLELAKDLARRQRNLTFVLLNRTSLPEAHLWEEIIQNDSDSKLIKKLKGIKEIERLGAKVITRGINVSNLVEMAQIRDEIKNLYGKINGVIHAAGVPGDGFLFKKDIESFNEVLQPKVYGTWILGHLFKEEELDFFLLFSSGLSLLSEPGHGDYSAANSFIDSFASYYSKQGTKTLAINWSTWKETGMAVDYGFNYDSIFKAISTESALEKLHLVLNKKVSRVLIGEVNYVPQFMKFLDRLPFAISDSINEKRNRVLQDTKSQVDGSEKRTVSKGKVELVGGDREHFSDTEFEIAQIYNEVLGYKEIDIHEGFFELGGDSVLLNRMHTLIEKKYPGKVKLIDLFNYTTVASLSSFIAEKSEDTCSDEDEFITDLLRDFEDGKLSIEDALKDMT